MFAINDFLLPGGLFLLAGAIGLQVSKLGKPYHSLLFSVHKLIALVGVVLGAVRLVRIDPLASFPAAANGLLALAAACVIALFTTGALLSIREGESRLALRVHQLSPALIALAAIGFLCCLPGLAG